MARLSKKLKREWAFFMSPKTGRRTYNDLCRKCRNDCKQSFRVIVVSCPLYCSKRSVKSVPNSNDFNDSGYRDEYRALCTYLEGKENGA